MAGAPQGFDPAKVVAGLHKAMAFGAPSRASDQAVFYIPVASTDTNPADQQGIPWSPTVRVNPTPTRVSVPCSYEFQDDAGKVEGFGIVSPVRLVLTLLDVDYQQIEGFERVVIGGRPYLYRRTEAPVALGTVDVWTVHCVAEDSA